MPMLGSCGENENIKYLSHVGYIIVISLSSPTEQ